MTSPRFKLPHPCSCIEAILTGCLLLFSFGNAPRAAAQQFTQATEAFHSRPDSDVKPAELPDAPLPSRGVTLAGTPKRILSDGVHVLQGPRFIRAADAKWLLPLTGAAVASFATDEKTMSEVVSSNPSFNQTSRNVSDGLRDGFIAVPVLMLGVGQFAHADHARETGILASEAMIDAYAVGALIKVASFRERPFTDRSEGSFYRLSAGTDSSFISGHSLVAWSSAAVLAEEYPNHWVQAGIYTLAGGVSLTRVLGQEHFPSDVLLGSAAGWLIGHYVYRAHHRHR